MSEVSRWTPVSACSTASPDDRGGSSSALAAGEAPPSPEYASVGLRRKRRSIATPERAAVARDVWRVDIPKFAQYVGVAFSSEGP
jgi:hypothetical protein